MYIYIYIYMHGWQADAPFCTYTHTLTHTYIHTYIHIHMQGWQSEADAPSVQTADKCSVTNVGSCFKPQVCTYMYAYMYACVIYVSMYAHSFRLLTYINTPMWVLAFSHEYVCVCMYVCMYVYVDITCMVAYSCILCISTCIHTYIHAITHTHT